MTDIDSATVDHEAIHLGEEGAIIYHQQKQSKRHRKTYDTLQTLTASTKIKLTQDNT